MIQGKESLKSNDLYSSLINPAKKSHAERLLNSLPKEENNLKADNKSKIQDLFNSTGLKTSEETSPQNLLKLYIEVDDNENSHINETTQTVNPEENLVNSDLDSSETPPIDEKTQRRENAYKAIEKTQTAISLAGTVLKITNQEGFSDLLESSSAVLSASKGVIDLDNVSKSENKTKTVMNSISKVTGGVATVLNVVDIPEAQFLTFTSKVVGLGVEQQDLNDNIKKKDARGIAGTSVSMAKGAWGTIVSGLEAAKLSATLGQKVGIIKPQTVVSITNSASKISNLAGKVAIPFAVAGTGLTIWDLKKDFDKVQDKESEIANLENEVTEEKIDPNFIKSETEDTNEKKSQLVKELHILKTNTQFRALSASLSVISTSALIASVAFPSVAKITGIIAVGGSITSSVAGTLSTEEKRKSAMGIYKTVKDNYGYVLSAADKLIFGSKSKA